MKLIFLFGPVASGKLTIARHLARITGLSLFHNHLVVDAVGAVFPFGSESFVTLRERFWLETFAYAARANRSLIFTFAPESTVPPDFPQRVRSSVESADGEVCFVQLKVSDHEQERRIIDVGRASHGKLMSLDSLRELRPMFNACLAAMPAPLITVDTDATPAEEAALKIAEALAIIGPSIVDDPRADRARDT
ncbi:MAG: shikimate kinase [Hyphomonadaceae bacterium]